MLAMICAILTTGHLHLRVLNRKLTVIKGVHT